MEAITQADSEVPIDPSIRTSPQPPPNNSNGTPNRSNELSDLSRNGQHVDTGKKKYFRKTESLFKNVIQIEVSFVCIVHLQLACMPVYIFVSGYHLRFGKLEISNQPRASCSSNVEITCTITP